jgi:outer membrane lipoprotein carrier protein
VTRALACWTLLLPAALSAQDASAALARAQQAYRSTRTFAAQFTQTIDNPMLGAPQRAVGSMFLAPPDRFAMRFTEPAGDRIVADGQWLWIYTPNAMPNQVIRQPIPRAGSASPNLMAQFVDRPLERYTVTYGGQETVSGVAVDVLRLTPRTDDLPFRSAEIAVARSDGLLRRIEVVERSGQRRTLVLHGIRHNEPIPPQEFRFEVPRGVRVVGG